VKQLNARPVFLLGGQSNKEGNVNTERFEKILTILKKSDERATVAKKRNEISMLLKEVVAKANRHDPSIHDNVACFEADMSSICFLIRD